MRQLRYIKGTLQLDLLSYKQQLHLPTYVDSNWAGDPPNKKSTIGYYALLGKTLLSWSVKKKNTVACSSTEAEYRAMAVIAVDITWIQRILQEFSAEQTTPTPLHCDNLSALALANKPIFHARTKHIEIDHHFIRDCIQAGIISVHHIVSQDQIPDIFTKALPTNIF